MKGLKHLTIIILALAIIVGAPALYYRDNISAAFANSVDVISSATLELPDQPSGEFFVIMNSDKHRDTMDEWKKFFLEEDAEVIFEDLSCTVIQGDANGMELAERFQARLAENQMTIKQENNILAASKLDKGVFDVMVVSQEFAEAYGITETFDKGHAELIRIAG